MILAFILFLLFLYIYLQGILLPLTKFQNTNNITEYFKLLFFYIYTKVYNFSTVTVKNIKN